MADDVRTDVKVAVRVREDQGTVELGAVVDGAFVAFAARKLGGYEKQLRLAAEAASSSKSKDEG